MLRIGSKKRSNKQNQFIIFSPVVCTALNAFWKVLN